MLMTGAKVTNVKSNTDSCLSDSERDSAENLVTSCISDTITKSH